MKTSTKKRNNKTNIKPNLAGGGGGNSHTSYGPGPGPKGQDPKESFDQFLKRIFPGEPQIPEGVTAKDYFHEGKSLYTYVPPEISVKEYHRVLRGEPSLKHPRNRGGKSRKKYRKPRI